jgi:signal transduction histidine kinase
MTPNLALLQTAAASAPESPLADSAGLEMVVEMAHDLCSPLSAILMLAESLRSGTAGPMNASQQRQVGLIYSAALRLCTTASDTIELARDDRRIADQRAIAFSVTELLAEVRDTVQPVAEAKGLALRVESLKSDWRHGNSRAVGRVLLNLATNALKFTERGYVEIAAREVAGRSSRIEFSVRDTGPGIPASALRTIYQAFREDPSRTNRHCFSSSGLGLTICRRLVTAMGSTLRVDSRAGEGTVFRFELTLPSASRRG